MSQKYILELPQKNGFVKSVELTKEQAETLAAKLKEAGIDFRTTPFTAEEIIEKAKP